VYSNHIFTLGVNTYYVVFTRTQMEGIWPAGSGYLHPSKKLARSYYQSLTHNGTNKSTSCDGKQ
jgi:hypothetical protein